MLAGAVTVDGEWLDHEYVSDILDLSCIEVRDAASIDGKKFNEKLEQRSEQLQKEVQGRNSRYYDQQEELLYRNQQDRHAESESKIRDYRNKEKEARKNSKATDDPLQQLKFKQEARKWSDKAEDEDDEARSARKKMREEAENYLLLIEQSLKGTSEIEDLFTIKWAVTS
jgi:membrane protein involved in colicin uptake